MDEISFKERSNNNNRQLIPETTCVLSEQNALNDLFQVNVIDHFSFTVLKVPVGVTISASLRHDFDKKIVEEILKNVFLAVHLKFTSLNIVSYKFSSGKTVGKCRHAPMSCQVAPLFFIRYPVMQISRKSKKFPF